MYIGSGAPRRLINIKPTQPHSEKPVLDLLTEYIVRVLSTATTGLAVEEGGYYDFDKTGVPAGDLTCTCGVTATGSEHYVREPGLFGIIMPSLALHYLVWHRVEVPESHLAVVRQAATDNLVNKIGQLHLEPPDLVVKRAAAQRTQAITIVRKTLEELRSRGKPTILADALAAAISDVGVQVGWGRTYPQRDAVVAVYKQLDPDGSTDYATDYLLGLIEEWASRPDRMLSDVELALERALEALNS